MIRNISGAQPRYSVKLASETRGSDSTPPDSCSATAGNQSTGKNKMTVPSPALRLSANITPSPEPVVKVTPPREIYFPIQQGSRCDLWFGRIVMIVVVGVLVVLLWKSIDSQQDNRDFTELFSKWKEAVDSRLTNGDTFDAVVNDAKKKIQNGVKEAGKHIPDGGEKLEKIAVEAFYTLTLVMQRLQQQSDCYKNALVDMNNKVLGQAAERAGKPLSEWLTQPLPKGYCPKGECTTMQACKHGWTTKPAAVAPTQSATMAAEAAAKADQVRRRRLTARLDRMSRPGSLSQGRGRTHP